jgi:Tfp pilus assembly protein PilO
MAATLQALEPRQINLVGFGAVGLLLAALLSFFVLPQWRAYRAAELSLTLLQANAQQGASLDTQLDLLRQEVASLERTLNGDAANLPAKKMQAFVIGRLQTISWRNNIELVGIKPRNGVPIAQFNELIFDVDLRGDYFKFFDWLENVGEELGFVVVKSFEMSPVGGDTEGPDPELQVKLTVASYRNGGAS